MKKVQIDIYYNYIRHYQTEIKEYSSNYELLSIIVDVTRKHSSQYSNYLLNKFQGAELLYDKELLNCFRPYLKRRTNDPTNFQIIIIDEL